mgnify:CR=1 FL=1
MQMKELSRATGVDVETIRFYEKQGLLPTPARRENGYRVYEAVHLERLAFIRHSRAAVTLANHFFLCCTEVVRSSERLPSKR